MKKRLCQILTLALVVTAVIGCGRDPALSEGGSDHPNELKGLALHSGNPVSRARVKLMDADSGYRQVDSTQTDSNGAFSLTGVSMPGAHRAAVQVLSVDSSSICLKRQVQIPVRGKSLDLGILELQESARLVATLDAVRCATADSVELGDSPFRGAVNSACAYSIYPVYPGSYSLWSHSVQHGRSALDTTVTLGGSNPVFQSSLVFSSSSQAMLSSSSLADTLPPPLSSSFAMLSSSETSSSIAMSSSYEMSSSSIALSSSSLSIQDTIDLRGISSASASSASYYNALYRMDPGNQLAFILPGHFNDSINGQCDSSLTVSFQKLFTPDGVDTTANRSGNWNVKIIPTGVGVGEVSIWKFGVVMVDSAVVKVMLSTMP